MTPEMVEGLYFNIPTIEAMEDVRFVLALGATFGGKESRPYLDAIFRMAYPEDVAEASSEMLDVTDAKFNQAR